MINVALELEKARRGHYAIGAFNTSNLEVTKAICAAAKNFQFPILIQTTPSAVEYAGLKTIFDIVRDEIENSGIRAAIHLDHAKDLHIIEAAIEIGYKSVMFDGSKYSYEENIAMTEKVVQIARKKGVSVEAEIGVISHEEGGRISGNAVLSTPDQVSEFVKLTGVDSIAVSVGNEHGAPADEKLNLHLLRSIGEVVDIPLVIHGASGLSTGDIREAIHCGAAKFNIDTNIRKAFANAIEQSANPDYREAMKEGMDDVRHVIHRYIKIFSNR